MELRNQIAQSGVHVDVDAPKGQDLSQIMAEIRAKYEKMAQKNQEELKAWHESQVSAQGQTVEAPLTISAKSKPSTILNFISTVDRSQKCRPRSPRTQRP